MFPKVLFHGFFSRATDRLHCTDICAGSDLSAETSGSEAWPSYFASGKLPG